MSKERIRLKQGEREREREREREKGVETVTKESTTVLESHS